MPDVDEAHPDYTAWPPGGDGFYGLVLLPEFVGGDSKAVEAYFFLVESCAYGL